MCYLNPSKHLSETVIKKDFKVKIILFIIIWTYNVTHDCIYAIYL